MILRSLVFACLAIALVAATPSFADEPRRHDGLHFVLGVGPGFTSTGVSFDPGLPGEPDIRANAFGTAGLLLIGGTPAEGLSVGASLLSGGHFFAVDVTVEGTATYNSGQDIVANLVGPYVDYYFDPAGGLHLLGIVGAGILRDANEDTDGVAVGFGAAVGLGYDWWVADRVSIGVLGRVQYLNTRQEIDTFVGSPTVRYSTIYPSVLATLVVH